MVQFTDPMLQRRAPVLAYAVDSRRLPIPWIAVTCLALAAAMYGLAGRPTGIEIIDDQYGLRTEVRWVVDGPLVVWSCEITLHANRSADLDDGATAAGNEHTKGTVTWQLIDVGNRHSGATLGLPRPILWPATHHLYGGTSSLYEEHVRLVPVANWLLLASAGRIAWWALWRVRTACRSQILR